MIIVFLASGLSTLMQCIDPLNNVFFGLIYVLMTSILVALQPLGTGLVPEYCSKDLVGNGRVSTEDGFKIRGIVTSINAILGAVLVGFLISALSIENVLTLVCGVLWLSFGLFLISQPSYKLPDSKPIPKPVTEPRVLNSISVFRLLLTNVVERRFVLISALSNSVLMPVLLYVTPIKLVTELGQSALDLGLVEGAYGVGMLLGSLAIRNWMNRCLGKNHATFLSVIAVAIGLVVVAVTENVLTIGIGLWLSGVGVVVYNINTTAIRCLATPESQRTAFESQFLALCILPIPLGFMFATWLVSLGHVEALLLSFAGFILVASLMVPTCKDFRDLCKLEPHALDGIYAKLYPI